MQQFKSLTVMKCMEEIVHIKYLCTAVYVYVCLAWMKKKAA